jgi:electron transfer flavoprotein alpha subunit
MKKRRLYADVSERAQSERNDFISVGAASDNGGMAVKMKIVTVLIGSRHSDSRFADRLACAAFIADPSCDLSLWYLSDDASTPSAQAYENIFCVDVAGCEIYCAESLLPVLTSLYATYSPDILLFPADIAGKELGVRLAARLCVACETNINKIQIVSEQLTVSKLVYNANLVAQFAVLQPAVLIVDPSSFEPAPAAKKTDALHLCHTVQGAQSWFSDASFSPFIGDTGIKSARVVVACGRGIQNRENVSKLERLARQFGGMLGGTRPAAVAGWVSPSQLIGISGSVVAPEICFVVGASGARAFAVGIKDSALLVGVNTDPSAPIFKICDIGAVCDGAEFAEALSEMIELEEKRQNHVTNK